MVIKDKLVLKSKYAIHMNKIINEKQPNQVWEAWAYLSQIKN